MHERHRHTWVVTIVALWATACRSDAAFSDVDKPAAPDFQPLLAAFARPTATLDADMLPSLARGLVQQVAAVDTLEVDRRVIEAARAGLMQLEAQSAAEPGVTQPALTGTEPPLTLRGDGFLVVTRICDGWGATPVPDLANGFMELTLGFTERGLDPVIWGKLSACRYAVVGHQIELDGDESDPRLGDLRLYIGRNATREGFGTFPDPVVVDLQGRLLVDGIEVAGGLSFRIDLVSRQLELLVPFATGHVIAVVPPQRSATLQVRAANGTFSCDLDAARCTTPSGETIGAP